MTDKRRIVLNADQLRKGSSKLKPSTKFIPSAVEGLRSGAQTFDKVYPERSRGAQIGRVKLRKNSIYIVLDNVLDTYNIGAIFRLADAVAVRKVYLCAGTETPPNHRIKKASINTTEWVEWEYAETALEAVKSLKLKVKSLQIVAIEQAAKSISYNTFEYKLPICLVVGHESDGVSKEVLKMADAIVELPMFGINKSLNVMVSLGIVLYEVISKSSRR